MKSSEPPRATWNDRHKNNRRGWDKVIRAVILQQLHEGPIVLSPEGVMRLRSIMNHPAGKGRVLDPPLSMDAFKCAICDTLLHNTENHYAGTKV